MIFLRHAFYRKVDCTNDMDMLSNYAKRHVLPFAAFPNLNLLSVSILKCMRCSDKFIHFHFSEILPIMINTQKRLRSYILYDIRFHLVSLPVIDIFA